jgi:hypothetical protein
VAAAATALPGVALIAGGKSFGGRMTSQAQAAEPLADVRGLCFFGFPLHPAGKPATERGAHLGEIKVPMLFMQGTKDALADVGLIEPMIASLAPRATLHLVADADHSFHVPVRSGRNDAQMMEEILDAMANWTTSVVDED